MDSGETKKGIDVNKGTINMLLDIQADIMLNQELLVQVLAKLDGRSKEEILANLDKHRNTRRAFCVDQLLKNNSVDI